MAATKKKARPWAFPPLAQAPFTIAAFAVFAIFIIDLFTFVLRRYNMYLISIEPMTGTLIGMLAVAREEHPRWSWIALGLNALYLVVVTVGITYQRGNFISPV